MVLYFLKSSGQYLSIEYKLISVGGLWAEQFAVKFPSDFPKIPSKHLHFRGGVGPPKNKNLRKSVLTLSKYINMNLQLPKKVLGLGGGVQG